MEKATAKVALRIPKPRTQLRVWSTSLFFLIQGIIDVTDKSYTVELTGDHGKNDAFLEAIDRGAILETVRTGASGIGRGERILRV